MIGAQEGQAPVVRHFDGRGDTVIVIFGARQVARIVVCVVRDNATRPNAAGELAVGRVVVRRPLAVGVAFATFNYWTSEHLTNSPYPSSTTGSNLPLCQFNLYATVDAQSRRSLVKKANSQV